MFCLFLSWLLLSVTRRSKSEYVSDDSPVCTHAKSTHHRWAAPRNQDVSASRQSSRDQVKLLRTGTFQNFRPCKVCWSAV